VESTHPAEKICTRCKISKPLDEFSPHIRGLFGRYTQCRPCTAAVGRARYVPRRVVENLPEGTKRCTQCKEIKVLAYFGKDGRWKSGYRSACIPCSTAQSTASRNRNRAHHDQRVKRWNEANADRQRSYRLKRLYGITSEQFDEMLAAQGGGCGICGHTATKGRWDRLAVDHDHACCAEKRSCGKCVRGILCGGCNLALGLLEKRIGADMAPVLAYLQKHRQ